MRLSLSISYTFNAMPHIAACSIDGIYREMRLPSPNAETLATVPRSSINATYPLRPYAELRFLHTTLVSSTLRPVPFLSHAAFTFYLPLTSTGPPFTVSKAKYRADYDYYRTCSPMTCSWEDVGCEIHCKLMSCTAWEHMPSLLFPLVFSSHVFTP